MGASCFILFLTLLPGQGTERGGWQLTPQLFPGLELAYAGTYTEEALIPGVQFSRTYRLRNTVLVLDSAADGWDAVLMTDFGLNDQRSAAKGSKPQQVPSSVRLEKVRIDRKGRVFNNAGQPVFIPTAGPPTLETGSFVELPAFRLGLNQAWEVSEPKQPPRSWQVLGPETCCGTTCVKIQGQQQTEDWDRPRADQSAWRRRETLWVAPTLGVAYKVERTIERRDPARRDPTAKSTVKYELESRLRYPGKLFDDRHDEIRKAIMFQAEAGPLVAQPGQNRLQIDSLVKKINYHLENSPPTPYRTAIHHLQSRLEQAQRGEASVLGHDQEKPPLVPGIRAGQRAPDFLVTNLIDGQSVRLYRNLGRAIVIAFFNPQAESGRQVLEFLKDLRRQAGNNVVVMAMAASNDVDLVRRQHADLQLPFPILDGTGLHLTFKVEATPRLILLDGEGIVRGMYTGWGPQVPREVEAELRNWLPH